MLWEREASLGVLDRCLAEAAGGEGRMVLVAGEAGVGKTSLVRDFCRRNPDASTWWGACDALATPSPLAPLYDIALEAGGRLEALMAGDGALFERFSGFLAAITRRAAAERPLIVVVEDVHWADQATLDLLVFLGRRVGGARAVVVVTYRDDELAADHPLRAVLGRLTGPQVRRLTVSCLSGAAVAGMAKGHEVDPAAVFRATGGNPFFVTELLAAPPGTVPQTVRDAVLARVAQLGPAARAVLEPVAVVPDRADVALVAEVAPDHAAAVRECERAGVLQVVGRTVGFRHELARRVVEATIAAVSLPDLHRTVLAYLEREPDPDPARLAYHAARADDPAAVLRHAPAAAAHASRLGAHPQALAHYREALRYADALPPAERADLLEAYAAECSATVRWADGLAALEAAVAVRREAGDVEGQARALARRAQCTYMTASVKEALEQLAEAVELVRDRPPSPAVLAVYTDAAFTYSVTQQREQVLELAPRAAALAEEYGDDERLSVALMSLGGMQWWDDPDRAEATLVRAVEAAHRSRQVQRVAVATGFLGATAADACRFRTADRWLTRAIEWCDEHDLEGRRDYYRAGLATSYFGQGRWARAAELVDALTDPDADVYPIARLTARLVGGRLAVRRGDPDQATPLAEAWEWVAGTGDPLRQWAVVAGRAEAAWHAGRAGEIPQIVDETYRGVRELRHPWAIGELAFWMWRGGALQRPPEGAAEPYALQIRGEWAAAARVWEEIGCPYEAAEALADGDDPVLLRSALERFYRLGARPAANRLVHRLRKLGVTDLPRRPHRSTGANPAGLTDRELEVAGLLAEGLSNADIAARLHVSLRTAGHHVAAVLAKLEVSNRREAAVAAREAGIGKAR